MPGVPGQPGHIPKRSDQRRRRNAPEPGMEITKAPGAAVVPVPPAFEDWDEIVIDWYESLNQSGQADFYEPSDWATAVIVSESLSRDFKPQPLIDQDGHAVLDSRGKPIMRKLPLKGANLSAYLRAFQVLMVTEGDRRRLRLELQRPSAQTPADPAVPNIDDYRDRLTAG